MRNNKMYTIFMELRPVARTSAKYVAHLYPWIAEKIFIKNINYRRLEEMREISILFLERSYKDFMFFVSPFQQIS